MSEKIHLTPEHQTVTPEVTAERPTSAHYGEHEQAEHIKRAEQAVATESARTEQVAAPQLPVTDDRPYLIDNAAKMLRMKQNLTQVQKRLKPAQKSFSGIIHQPLVRRVSESAGKTVSRPSGMLGGGLLAFVGSLLYLYATNHYGFAYNYGLFLVFFIIGFALGVAVEYGFYGLRRLAASR